MEDFLQPGVKQVCAGYAIYGPSTMLVLTTGHGVNGFTLDPKTGQEHIVPITATGDFPWMLPQWKDLSSRVTTMALSLKAVAVDSTASP